MGLREARTVLPEVSRSKLPRTLVAQRSRRRIAPFRLHRPDTITEALALFEAAQGSAAYMSGGVDLINRMKLGYPVSDLVHLGRLPAYRSIKTAGEDLVIGAGATHQDLATSDRVRREASSLAQAWSTVANVRVRMKGTLGGNLMARDGNNDFPMVALALGAELGFVCIQTGETPRGIGDLSQSAASDLLLWIRIPNVRSQEVVIERQWKPVVAFALAFFHGGAGVQRIRLATGTGFADGCLRQLLLTTPLSSADIRARQEELATALLADLPVPIEDRIASAAYRRRLLEITVRRRLATFASEQAEARC